MKSRLALCALLLCSAALSVGTMQSRACDPDGKIMFICGVVSPEDLVAVPRSDWVVASGFTGGAVHLVNTRNHSTVQVYPAATRLERFDKKTYASCPGPMDPAEKEKFSAHGLAVAAGPDRVHAVYVVHHGFRVGQRFQEGSYAALAVRSIELFPEGIPFLLLGIGRL